MRPAGLLAALALTGGSLLAQAPEPKPFTDTLSWGRPQYPSTYQRRPFQPVLIPSASVFTSARPERRSAGGK